MTSQRQQNGPPIVNGNADEVAASISSYLESNHVPPSSPWIQSFIPTIRLNTPIVALQKTALFRILATDLQSSMQRSSASCFPAGLTEPSVKERTVRGPVTVQVLDVEDIGRSRWSQLEAIELQERGETTKGREIVRVVRDESSTETIAQQSRNISLGPHKLLLQDANGSQIYAVELGSVNGINLTMSIGAKLVLQDFVVARGAILLEPRNVETLGGKVDAWDKKWKEERKHVLKQKAGVRETS